MKAKSLCLSSIVIVLASMAMTGCAPGASQTASLPDETSHEALPAGGSDLGSVPAQNVSSSFIIPAYSDSQQAQILAKYNYVDPQKVIPDSLLRAALTYYFANQALLPNPNVLSVIDFAKYSGEKRFFVIDMKSGTVFSTYVAHGSGSDPQHTGYATKFSNTPGSEMSSLGVYLTAETYIGTHGLSLRLDGLSSSNSNVRSRAIVLHGADYVQELDVNQGRSWGCTAVAMAERDKMVGLLKGGSIIYAGLSQAGN